MKQKSLKHRHIQQLFDEKLKESEKIFIPSQDSAQKSLRNRVQTLRGRSVWMAQDQSTQGALK